MPSTFPIDKKRNEELFRLFEDDNFLDRGARGAFDERLVKIYNAYRNRVKEKVFPWKGCSNTSVPLITRATDRMTIHVMQSIAPNGAFSNMSAQPVSSHPLAEKKAEDTTDYIQYYWRNRMRILDQLERYVRNFILYGNGIGKLWWRRVERMQRRIEREPMFQDIPGEDPEAPPERRKVPLDGQIIDFFGMMEVVKDLKRIGKGSKGTKWSITVWDEVDRREKEIQIEGYSHEESRENIFLMESRETVINQPQFDNIEIPDCVFTVDGRSIQEAKRVSVRYEKSWDDMVRGFRTGKWNQITQADMDEMELIADVDEVTGDAELENLGLTPLNQVVGERLKRQQDATEGNITTRRYPFEVIEEFRRIDLDHDGEDEDVVIWYEGRTRKVLRIEHQFVDYHMHERPMVHSGLIPIGNRLLHIGIGEALFPLLVELNSTFNSRNDAATMSVSPGGFYRPGSGFDPGPMSWSPGMWLPVDNPQADVREYVPVANTRDAIHVEQFLLALSEDLSISTQTMGRGPDRPNAPRTARGTLAILQQDAIKLDYLLLRLSPALHELSEKTLNLLRMNAPESEEFRITGKNGMRSIRKDDLNMKYDFFWELDSVSNNKEIKRQYAATALEALMPIAQQPPEAISPGARILARRFAEMLDMPNPESIIPDPQGFDRAPMTQDEETKAMIQGIPIRPILPDNHEQHVLEMDAFEQSEDFGSVPTEWVTGVWAPHKQAHLEMQRVVENQQAQQSGQRRNARQGNQGNFRGEEGLFNPDLGGQAGLSEVAAEGLGSTFTGG